SLAPATTTDGSCASIATAGSFCLFCENRDAGLPTVTSVPAVGWLVAGWAIAVPAPASTTDNTAPAAANLTCRIGAPLRLSRGADLAPPCRPFVSPFTKPGPV